MILTGPSFRHIVIHCVVARIFILSSYVTITLKHAGRERVGTWIFKDIFSPDKAKLEKHDNLEVALSICDNYDPNCKGIWDKFCNGETIYTCGEINDATDPDSPDNGCTYIKEGNIRMSFI